MPTIHLRSLIFFCFFACLAACGGDNKAGAESGAHKAAEDGKRAMSDASAKLKELRGGRSGDGTQAGAEEALPDWFPEDIWLPDDFTLISAQAPLPGTFLVHGTSSKPASELVSAYRAALARAGYEVAEPERTPSPGQVLFSMNGLEGGDVMITEGDGIRQIRMGFTKDAR